MNSIIPIAALAVPDVPSWLIIAIILALLYVGVREVGRSEVGQSDAVPKRKRRGSVIALVLLLLVLIVSFVAWQKLGSLF